MASQTPTPATPQRAAAAPQPAAQTDAELTPQELRDTINALREGIEALRMDNLQLQQQIGIQGNNHGKHKYPGPTPYDGREGNVQMFLTQAKAYLKYYSASFPNESDKVMCIAGYLKGDALSWFEPTMRDYLTKEEEAQEDNTREIFQSYETFEAKLKGTFGSPDEVRTAERQLMKHQQKGSAATYAAGFRQIISKLDWDDDAYIAQFYQGLKEDIKDEVARMDRPSELSEYIELVVRIDNRLYERKMERKGQQPVHRPMIANSGKKRQSDQPFRRNNDGWRNKTSYGDHAGPMDLDATHHSKPKFDGECYNCGKKGHPARFCTEPKKPRQWKPVPERRTNAIQRGTTALDGEGKNSTSTPSVPHELLSWTACYDDSCGTHRADKDGSGWYPKKPRGKRTMAMVRRGIVNQPTEARKDKKTAIKDTERSEPAKLEAAWQKAGNARRRL